MVVLIMRVIVCFLVLTATVIGREYSDEEISSFPKLFHLDDYEQCLSKKDGLYCMGIFDLSPEYGQPNPRYNLLKEYSDESYRHFNRTRIHRGYCVSSRCPNNKVNSELARFESCVDKNARLLSLRASINEFQYCHNYTDRHKEMVTTAAQNIFLQCVCAIIVLNVIGTVYDVYSTDDSKNKLITAFSIPVNWRRLTAVDVDSENQLAPLNGYRLLGMKSTMLAHSYFISFNYYLSKPEELELYTQGLYGRYSSDGTVLIQTLLLLSRFLTTYNLLKSSQKRPLSLSMLPRYVVKRIIRILPVHLLILGFASTWWPRLRDGPLVPITIGAESNNCYKKFWIHAIFANNIIHRDEFCSTPTWFLPVDLQTYILCCMLTLVMWRYREKAIKLYVTLFLASFTFNGIMIFFKEYKPIVYVFTPENMRTTLKDIPSYTDFYISTWGALPACFLGILMAHIQFEIEQKHINLSKYKWFVYLYQISLTIYCLWTLKAKLAFLYSTAYLILDTSLHCIVTVIVLLGFIHIDGPTRTFLGWSGWTILTRMSLPVLISHWLVNMTIITKPLLHSTSTLDLMADMAATTFISYGLAIPMTILVELPVRTFVELLIF